MYSVIAEPSRDFLNLGSRNDLPFSQASHKVFPSTHSLWKCGSKLEPSRRSNRAIGAEARFTSLKCKSCLRVGTPFVLGPKKKLLKLSAFKSNSQNDGSGGRPIGSKSLKNSVGISYVPQDSEATLVDSAKPHSDPTSYSSEESTTGSLVIQNLFKSWLMLLRNPPSKHVIDESLEEASSMGTSQNRDAVQQKGRINILKMVWCFFLSLDVTIKIPLVIFMPLYLAINIMYGAEVSRELTPLWVLGPLIAALYIRLCCGIGALYVFSFKHAIKLLINLPAYYLVAHEYIANGKLNQVVRHLFQPLVDLKNTDYKEASKRKLKELEVFLVEKYLDFVESIWPYYCRTIRFLKRANLI